MVVRAKHGCMKDHHVVGVAVDRAAVDCHVAVAHGTVAVAAVDATHFCGKQTNRWPKQWVEEKEEEKEDKEMDIVNKNK